MCETQKQSIDWESRAVQPGYHCPGRVGKIQVAALAFADTAH